MNEITNECKSIFEEETRKNIFNQRKRKENN